MQDNGTIRVFVHHFSVLDRREQTIADSELEAAHFDCGAQN